MLANEVQRLTPQALVGVLEISELPPFLAKLIVTTVTMVAYATIVIGLKAWDFPALGILIGIVPALFYLCFRFTNAEPYLWLDSELLGGTATLKYSSELKLSSEMTTVLATSLEPGDFIVPAYLFEAESGEQQGPSYDDFHRVIAIASPSREKVRIGVLGREHPYITGPEEKYYRIHAGTPRILKPRRERSAEVGKALADLIDRLPDDESGKESDLVTALIRECDNSPSSARLAVRVALDGKLIVRRRRASFALAVLRLHGSRAPTSGHSACELFITDLGRIWKHAPSQGHEDTDLSARTIYMGDININTGIAASMGRDNVVENSANENIWHESSDIELKDLASQLATLRVELTKMAISAEQDRVIADITAAQRAAEKDNAASAMRSLAHVGDVASARKWVLDTAASVGTPIAVEAIKRALHLP